MPFLGSRGSGVCWSGASAGGLGWCRGISAATAHGAGVAGDAKEAASERYDEDHRAVDHRPALAAVCSSATF